MDKEKRKAAAKKYYENNKEEIGRKNKIRYHENKEQQKLTQKKYRETHDRTEYFANYNEENKETIKEKQKIYNKSIKARFGKLLAGARRREIEVHINIQEYEILVSEPCFYCNGYFGLLTDTKCGYYLDRLDCNEHYIWDNSVPCCGFCNFTRGDRLTPEETKNLISILIEIRETNKRKNDMADTLGSLIDKLATTNKKMFLNQNLLYEIRRLSLEEFKTKYFSEEGMSQLWECLKKCCDLNVQRSQLVTEVDEKVIEMIEAAKNGEELDNGKFLQRQHKTY